MAVQLETVPSAKQTQPLRTVPSEVHGPKGAGAPSPDGQAGDEPPLPVDPPASSSPAPPVEMGASWCPPPRPPRETVPASFWSSEPEHWPNEPEQAANARPANSDHLTGAWSLTSDGEGKGGRAP